MPEHHNGPKTTVARHTDQSQGDISPRLLKLAKSLAPWTLFALLFLWGWRVENWFHAVPYYADTVEMLWAMQWYYESLFVRHSSPLYYPLVFYPAGWYVATLAHGPGLISLLLPLYALGGPAFAWNGALLLSFILAFAGMYKLARRFAGVLPANVAALLFTFWGFRWYRIRGHLHVLLGSSLLPWMAWGLERAFHSPTRSKLWYVLVGVFWALAIISHLYYLWIGGILLLIWVLTRRLSGQITWGSAAQSTVIPTLTALVLSAPAIILFLDGYTKAGGTLFNINQMLGWGASLNSLPIPSVLHPWLQLVTQWIYRGPLDESAMVNLGSVAFLLVLLLLPKAWKHKAWRPALSLTMAGLLLALGLNIRWNGEVLQCETFYPINKVIWHLGRSLKPDVFVFQQPPEPFAEAIPLPGIILTATVPFWQGARVLARYAAMAGVGFFLLVSLGLEQLRSVWARLILAAFLIVEIVPPPTTSVPYPPSCHSAFDWLEQQSLSHESIVDLYAWKPDRLNLFIRGHILVETLCHGKPTISGVGNVFPKETRSLLDWFAHHPYPFKTEEFMPLLHSLRVRYVVIHMTSDHEWTHLDDAEHVQGLDLVECFPAPAEATPWNWPICILEILPSETEQSNVVTKKGCSDLKEWGCWMTRTESRALWLASDQADHRLTVMAFPICIADQEQFASIQVNGVPLAEHRWDNCESWEAELIIPGSLTSDCTYAVEQGAL